MLKALGLRSPRVGRVAPIWMVTVVLAVSVAVGASVAPAAHATEPIRRVAGIDRYETAAQLSATFFSAADVVVVASGSDYPDALAAGPAAADGGSPLLLTESDRLPEATADELRRLQPPEIVVVGGQRSISASVETQLTQFGRVRRIAGGDRYDTATQVARAYFTESSRVVVASGDGFADALAAGAYAARNSAPLLLTARESLPAATEAFLAELGPEEIVVVGGPVAVSDVVVEDLNAVAPVTRIAGSTRYETATKLGSPDAARTLLVSGAGFADALAATPVAARSGQVLLAAGPCLPSATASALRGELITAGGRNSVAAPAAAGVECSPHTPPVLQFDAGATDEEIASIYAEVVEAQRGMGDAGPVVLTIHDHDFGPVPDGRSSTPGTAGWLVLDIYLPSYRSYGTNQLGIVTHEYAHNVQYWLAEDDAVDTGEPSTLGSSGIVPIWLFEGSAQSVADRVVGRAPRDKSQCVTTAKLADLIQYEDFNGTDRDGRSCLAIVAADYLTARFGPESVLHEYWRNLSSASDWQGPFARTFGITPEQFYEDFEQYRTT